MTVQAQLDDGTTLEFPDGTDERVISAVVKRHTKQPETTLSDALKSFAVAPAKAAVGFAGLTGDVADLAKAGKEKVLSYFPEWAQNADKITSLVSPVNALTNILPRSQPVRSAIEQGIGPIPGTGPWYEPQTRTGKVVDTATQAATTFGRSLLTQPLKALPVLAGITAGTEGAGALTDDKPWARFAGGFLGGGIPALTQAARSRPGVILKDALGTKTQAEIAAAIARQNEAATLGVPLMGTESFDAGHQLASAVLAHPSGNRAIEQFLKQRPAQVEGAVKRGLLAETGPLDTPANNAARAQQAATDVIANAKNERAAATAPFYQAAESETLSPQALAPVQKEIQSLLFKAPENSVARKAVEGWEKQLFPDLPETNVGRLNEIYKTLGIERKTNIGSTPEQTIASIPAGRVQDELGGVLKRESPNIAAGQATHSQFTRDRLEPLRAGPVGLVAGKTGIDPTVPSPMPRIVSAIADSSTARPETIRNLYTELNTTNKQAFPGIVQTHLENQLNASLEKIRSGPNATAGAKFAQAIVGTPQERANFEEMMRGVAIARGADPKAVVAGANTLLDVLESTGRTPGIGSATQPRGELTKEMSKTFLGDAASSLSTTPTKALAGRFTDWVTRGRYEDFARVLTAEDSVQQLTKLAKLNPRSVTARFYAASLLGLDRAIAGDGQ